MRPARFQQLLIAAADALPGATVKPFEDGGRHPSGVTVNVAGRTSR
ncbi:hypothetical protein ACIGXI_26375 [Kitasatospora aureofaciens]